MKYFFFIFLLITSAIHTNPLRQRPKLLTSEDIQKLETDWQTQFTWHNKGFSFTCCYEHGSSGFILKWHGIPIRSYNYPYISNIKKSLFNSSDNQYGYYFAEPIRFDNPSPEPLKFEDLCSILQDKSFAFYTGAGISASGNVATMTGLEKSLKIDTGFKNFLREILFNPKIITDAFFEFCKSAVYGDPTPAHLALHHIAQTRNISIVTENVDLLQQRTGSNPIFVHSEELYCMKDAEYLEIDALVCIGLSHDDCGFIAHYKQKNPRGIIIAIDLGNPNYLSWQDYIVREDLQVVVPYLAHFLCS